MNYIKPNSNEREIIAQSLLAGSAQVIDNGVCPICGKRGGHKGWCQFHKNKH